MRTQGRAGCQHRSPAEHNGQARRRTRPQAPRAGGLLGGRPSLPCTPGRVALGEEMLIAGRGVCLGKIAALTAHFVINFVQRLHCDVLLPISVCSVLERGRP